jgi:hypothetical protein
MSLPPVSVIRDGRFFIRLLVEQVRRTVGDRDYEIVVVDRDSHDGSRTWLAGQPDQPIPDVTIPSQEQESWERVPGDQRDSKQADSKQENNQSVTELHRVCRRVSQRGRKWRCAQGV